MDCDASQTASYSQVAETCNESRWDEKVLLQRSKRAKNHILGQLNNICEETVPNYQ